MPQAAERDDAALGRWTIGIVLAIVLSVIILPTVRERSRREFRLVVPAGTDLHGVTLDSKVRIGGIVSGRVHRITPLVNDQPFDDPDSPGNRENDRITGTELVLAIDRGVRLFPGAKASIQREMVSGLAIISIPSLGDEAPQAKPLRNGDSLTLLPQEDDLGKLLEEREKEDRFGWMTAAFREVQTGWSTAQAEAEALAAEVRETWPAVEQRGTAVFDRFEAAGKRLEATFVEVDRLRDDIVSLDREAEPAFAAIRADFAAMSDSSVRLGERFDSVFPQSNAVFSRETERIVSALHALEMRLASLRLGMNWEELLADLSLTGIELRRALGDLVALAARALAGDSKADRIQDRIDEVGRDLLAAVEQARQAEAELRAIATAGRLQADLLPDLSEAIGKIGTLLEAADRIERAYRDLRLEGIPFRPGLSP